MTVQLVPFQRSISVSVVPPMLASPTPKQLVVLGHDTPDSSLGSEVAGCGVSVTVHPRVAAGRGAAPATVPTTTLTDTINVAKIRACRVLVTTRV